MTKTKVTKKDNFMAIENILREQGHDALADVMAHELELLAKKNAGKSKVSAAEQKVRDTIADAVVEILANATAPMPCAGIAKQVDGDVSTQKLTPILRGLVESKVITSEKVKGKTLYSIA